jgi:hypothetical protein
MIMALALVVILAALGAPLQLIALAGAGVLVPGLLSRPRAATLLFIGVLYANVPVVAMNFHGVPDMLATAGPLLLLGIPFMSYLVFRRADPVVTPTLFWMVAYLVVQLISAAIAVSPDAAAEVVAVYFSEGLILYLLLTNAVRDWQTLRAAVATLVVVGALLGGLSIYQELTSSYRNQFWGFAQTAEEAQVERLDPGAQPRLAGPIGESNRYAQVMQMILPLALFTFLTAKTRRGRLLAAAAGIAILAGMLLTFSRGAGVATLVLIAIAIGLRYVRLRHSVVVAAALAVAVTLFAPGYVERIVSLEGVSALVSEGGGDTDNAILGRATSNLAALNVFVDYPIVGVGPGQFATYYLEYGNELGLRFREEPRRAHSMPLEVAADTGILGVLTLGAVFGTTLLGLWRARRAWLTRNPEYAAWSTAFILAITGYLLTGLFLHLSYMRYLWLIIALANSLVWILDREARPEAAAAGSTPEDGQPSAGSQAPLRRGTWPIAPTGGPA